MNRIGQQTGFTIVELLVAIFSFTLIAAGITILLANIFSVNNKQAGLLSDQDQTRRLSFRMMSELRNAATANTGAYALNDASPQQLTFYANIDGGVEVERIRYFVQSGQLMRGVVKPTGSPLAYNLASETATAVQNNLANGGNPVFYYYNDSYNGVTDNPLTQPVNVTAVKLVKANLQVLLKAGKVNTNSYTVTAIGTVRNLKSNLGN